MDWCDEEQISIHFSNVWRDGQTNISRKGFYLWQMCLLQSGCRVQKVAVRPIFVVKTNEKEFSCWLRWPPKKSIPVPGTRGGYAVESVIRDDSDLEKLTDPCPRSKKSGNNNNKIVGVIFDYERVEWEAQSAQHFCVVENISNQQQLEMIES